MSAPSELTGKLWPFTITAKGTKAVETIGPAVKFAVYARAVAGIILALAFLVGGHDCSLGR
ncbi:hypothetical protein [Bradyrhizobium sp. USDA 336]|uniref:hypothetical protein n=1 Tax=Bradyrhizobium sp. USDA 336 TaxID=3156311 RepID=UPI0038335B23